MPARVVIVEDQEMMRRSMAALLREEGFETAAFGRPEEALKELGRLRPDVVVSDIRMPGMDGMEMLAEIKRAFPLVEVVLVTAYGAVKDAVKAMRAGAADYLLKPFEPEEFLVVVQKALERKCLLQQQDLRERDGADAAPVLVGAAGGLADVFAGIQQVAASDAAVFIRGESGVGKEVAARLIHALSPRAGGPFVKVNCAALSAGLLESELFGHVKGAFTGAENDRVGRFDLADGGTMLLDEVSEIEPRLQAKLLRVLQENEFEPVGSSRTRRVDVRIIATSNRDVERAVEHGELREDLYFRLNVFPLYMPPLREHKEDLPALVEHWLKKVAPALGRRGLSVAPEAMRALEAYDWPGNVRELFNVLERSAVLAAGGRGASGGPEMRQVLIGPPVNGRGGSPTLGQAGQPRPAVVLPVTAGMTLRDVERELILRTLERLGGNRKRTAEALDIPERTLRDKLRRLRAASQASEPPLAHTGGNCR